MSYTLAKENGHVQTFSTLAECEAAKGPNDAIHEGYHSWREYKAVNGELVQLTGAELESKREKPQPNPRMILKFFHESLSSIKTDINAAGAQTLNLDASIQKLENFMSKFQ